MRRELQFTSLSEVAGDLDRLLTGGYQKAGQWDLAQCCNHLNHFMAQPLDGFTDRLPWALKLAATLFGKVIFRQIQRDHKLREGTPTTQRDLPPPGGNEAAAVATLKQTLQRFEQATTFHPSPFFGVLTRDEWHELQRTHCAHHLSFLIPNT